MSRVSLGKVSCVPRGEYSGAARYERLDIVTHNGGSYMAVRESSGVTPPNGEYWQLIAGKGDIGPAGERGIRGEQGPAGNVMFAAFAVNEDGDLIMTTPEGYGGPMFRLNENCDLEVII